MGEHSRLSRILYCNKENADRNEAFLKAINPETEEDYVILDVRTEAEFAAGHIPGAICVPNEIIQSIKVEKSDEVSSETSNLETSSNAAASSSETLIPELPYKNQMILVYCRSGNRSKQASQKLVDMGYTQVYEFGGIIDWPGQIVK